MRRTLPVLLALMLAVLLTGAGSTGPAAAGNAAAVTAKSYQKQVVKVTNKKRVKHDLVKVRKQKCVQRMAVAQAKRMAKQRRIFHQDLGRVLRQCNLGMAGENVASGYPNGRAVVRAWMQSPGHRANILERRYRLIGVGARKAGGRWYVAQVFGRR